MAGAKTTDKALKLRVGILTFYEDIKVLSSTLNDILQQKYKIFLLTLYFYFSCGKMNNV